MTRVAWLLALLSLAPGCRKKRPAESVEPAPVAAAPTADSPLLPSENAPATPTANADLASRQPTVLELQTAVEPLVPRLERCAQSSKVSQTTGLRFRVAPNGEVNAAQIVGNPNADDCVTQVLRDFRVPPWTGEPAIVGLPVSPDGKLMRQRAPGVD